MASNKLIQLAIGALMFSGWVVYLAGVADSNSICVKSGNGDYTTDDIISSVDDADKSFFPLKDPWGLPTASNSLAALLAGRKLKAEPEALFPSHSRALREVSTTTNNCGWTYSFAWWTVALQGFATILALLVAAGALGSIRNAVTPLLIVNTALLCVIASDLVPQAANLTITKTKGKWPNSIFVTTAGIIITLVANFFYFFVPPTEDISSGAPVEAK